PDEYIVGRGRTGNRASGAHWADYDNWFDIHERCDGTRLDVGYRPFNCSNNNEIWSFHNGGGNFLFCDGSVHFVTNDVDPDVFVSAVSAMGGDVSTLEL